VLKTQGIELVSVQEKPRHCCCINAGIYIANPLVLSYVSKGERTDITDIINRLLENNEKIVTYTIKEYWLDIGHMEDFSNANNNFEKLGFV
jgi:NDP-sugar pyrophosphorylase family protein